ncbi:hypothetical protein V5O48_003118 [Marasmius crinis-equi]|uniref:MYND-type domain-containing protein n=1 Tax=Marasmius crinis-equi TaxID=585013 RepID=A0ABR3FU95_9AGAR
MPFNPYYTMDILDNAHLLHATQRFTTSKRALQHLARLGSPPKPSAFNKSHPSAHVEEAVQVLATIVDAGKESTASMSTIIAGDIQIHWTHLAPWIKFFLEEVVISRSIPNTIEEYNLFEHTIAYIPLIMIICPEIPAFFAFIYRVSPVLFPCFIQAWWRSVDEHHPSARPWSLVVLQGLEAIAGAKDTPKVRPNGPYLPNHDLGIIYARHVDFISPHIRSMPLFELRFVHSYMQCISRPCFPGTVIPNFLRTVSPTMIPPLLSLFHGILFKRPFLRGKAPLDIDELFTTYEILFLTIVHILCLMKEAVPILHILETGVIKCIVEGLPLVAKHRNQEPQLFMKIAFQAHEILDCIARFLVYPAILHEFLKSLKNLGNPDALDQELLMISKELGESWLRLKQKATFLRIVRRDLKEGAPAEICGSSKYLVVIQRSPIEQCPLRPKGSGKTPTQNRRKVQYLRCSSCQQVMYCSINCQRSDWRAGHKKTCRDLTKNRKDQPFTTNYDREFFEQWGKVFIEMNAREIRAIIESYRSSLRVARPTTSLSADERLVARGKNPLILLDFDTPGFKPTDCVKVVDSTNFLADTRLAVMPASRESLLTTWREPVFDGRNIVAYVLLPRATDLLPWPMNLAMDLPDGPKRS